MRAFRVIAVTVFVWFGLIVTGGVTAASATSGGVVHGYDCTGGNVPPGVYANVLVTGVCYMPAGAITVLGNVTVAPGALLDNGSPGDPAGSQTPVAAAQLTVGGNVTVKSGGVLLLGCSPNGACAMGLSTVHIRGNLSGFGALGVVVHNTDIGGNLTLFGGGGGTMGGVATGKCFAATPPAPWSADSHAAVQGSPVYSDVEDSAIGGNYTVIGVSSCWLGSLRNQIGGNATFAGNKMGDPDAMEIGNNLVRGNLACFQNAPAPQFGDGAAPDLVGRHALGQCGFDVVLHNPSPGALQSNMTPGVGVREHFAVSIRSLGTFTGTHTVTAAGPPLESVMTDAGNTVVAQINNFVLAGTGLVGTGTSNGGPPGRSPGEAVLAIVHPNGSDQFMAFDNCSSCSFAGQSGAVSIRAYGTTTPSGFTSGTFLITSSGTVLPTASSPVPGLATLTGFGRFWGSGSTLHLVEHLGFG